MIELLSDALVYLHTNQEFRTEFIQGIPLRSRQMTVIRIWHFFGSIPLVSKN